MYHISAVILSTPAPERAAGGRHPHHAASRTAENMQRRRRRRRLGRQKPGGDASRGGRLFASADRGSVLRACSGSDSGSADGPRRAPGVFPHLKQGPVSPGEKRKEKKRKTLRVCVVCLVGVLQVDQATQSMTSGAGS